jgi:SNF2 family DNA or RNA helicase
VELSLSALVERAKVQPAQAPPASIADQKRVVPPSTIEGSPAAMAEDEGKPRGRPRRKVQDGAVAAAATAEQEDGDDYEENGDQYAMSRRANTSDGLPAKRGRKKAIVDGGEDDEDGEFEVPRSLRYPRGVSTKALRRAQKEQSQDVGSFGGQGSRTRRARTSTQPGDRGLLLPDCERILELLEGDESITPFLEPVDVVEYSDYLSIVQWPMDLSKIRQRLDGALHPEAKRDDEAGAAPPPPPPPMMVQSSTVVIPQASHSVADTYTPANFCRDVRLVWSNCLLYNRRGTPIYKLAKHFSQQFEELLAQSHQGRDVATLHVEPAPQMLQRARRQSRASAKSYNEEDMEDWWDDSSEEEKSAPDRKREKQTEPADESERKVDKILASRKSQLPPAADGVIAVDGVAGALKSEAVDGEGKGKEELKSEVVKSDGVKHDGVKSEPAEGDALAAVVAPSVDGVLKPEQKEYLVKWEGMSYLHVEWVPHSRISRQRQKLRRYEAQLAQNREQGIEEPEEPFDPRFTEVQRVIDNVKEANGTEWFMVKWEELPYAECTWESREDIRDDAKVEEFMKWNKVPPQPPSRPESKSHTNLAQGLNYCNGNELRSYQLEGLNWLIYNWYQRRGSILADEMGLGKTIQAVSFLHYLREREHIPGPFMIACNLSTLEHWYREIREWTDLNVVMYYGSREDRAVIREHEFFFKNEKGHIVSPHMRRAQVVLTTYDMVTAEDWEELRIIRWACVIVDEAQRMKGHSSKFRDNMISMVCDHRVLLTGTPIQNNTTELWALLNFVDPREFSSMTSFQARFGTLTTSNQVTELHASLRPYLLRRMKEDVEKSIPPKEETIVEVELTSIQKQYYRAVLEQNRSFLNRGCIGHNVPHLLNVAIQLRKVCNHPYLLRGVEDKEVGEHLAADKYLETFVKASGKMVLLDKLLPKLRAGGHRVLIFSQMVKVLDLLETYLAHCQWKWERIDGSIRGNDRQLAIDRFCAPDSDRFVFLLCTRAGGVGINLTAADTVIIFDSDWNPQNDVQAQARCHRIGQKEMVKVYRLITRNTYEREMFERSSKKLGLDQAVLHNMDLKADTVLDGKDVEELLRFGAYDLFRPEDEDDDRARQFCEADIDKILENQAVNVTYDRKKMTADGSTFSKAVFQASAADRSIDMHADNFWDLVLGAEHNAAYLLDQLQTGGATDTEESIAEFFKDLEAVVNSARRAWETGRAGELPADLHILSKVLQIVFETPDFTAAQRATAQQWYRAVITPSRRGRDDGDFASRRASSTVTIGRGNNADNDDKWTRYERSRLQKLLVNFAAPRWAEMKGQGGLAKRSVAEVKAFVLDFVRQCARHSDEVSAAVFRDLVKALDPAEGARELPAESEVDGSLSEAAYVQFIKSKSASWARRITEVRKVQALVADDTLEVPPLKKLLTRWWGPTADLQLLHAVAEHGMEPDAVQRIVKDAKYMFVNHVRPEEAAAVAAEDAEEEAAAAAAVAVAPGKRGRGGSASRSRGGGSKTKARKDVAAPDGAPPSKAAAAAAAAATPAMSTAPRVVSVEVVYKGVPRVCEARIEEAKFKDPFLFEVYNPSTGLLQKRVTFLLRELAGADSESDGHEDE